LKAVRIPFDTIRLPFDCNSTANNSWTTVVSQSNRSKFQRINIAPLCLQWHAVPDTDVNIFLAVENS